MRKTACALWAVVLLLAVSSLLGADFWKKKPCKQWTSDEVQKMLNNSPWAREVLLAGAPDALRRDGVAEPPAHKNFVRHGHEGRIQARS